MKKDTRDNNKYKRDNFNNISNSSISVVSAISVVSPHLCQQKLIM